MISCLGAYPNRLQRYRVSAAKLADTPLFTAVRNINQITRCDLSNRKRKGTMGRPLIEVIEKDNGLQIK